MFDVLRAGGWCGVLYSDSIDLSKRLCGQKCLPALSMMTSSLGVRDSRVAFAVASALSILLM